MAESIDNLDGHTLSAIAEMLRSSDPEKRANARNVFNKLGDRALADLIEASTKDLKTGLENQAMLEQAVLEIIHSEYETGLVIVTDLVGFKQINDKYGQAVGDEVLVAYAEAIRSTIRTATDDDNPKTDAMYKLDASSINDEHAFRIGGDEYSVLLRNGANLALADHTLLVRTKLINSLNNQTIISVLKKYSISKFGVRASFAFINPIEHSSFSDVLRSMGSKQDTYCEYCLHITQDGGNVVTVVR